MPRPLQSLKLQIALAIGVLTLLFASSTLYSLYVIDQQHSDDVLVQLAGRLQFNQQHLTVQAMRYIENAPRDYPSYYRDLGLYFEDLKKTRAELSKIIDAFAKDRFDQVFGDQSPTMPPHLPSASQSVAVKLALAWQEFTTQLDQRIGPNIDEPRLEWAAGWIVEEHAKLEKIAEDFMTTLEGDVAARAARANLINRLLLFAALLVALGIALWFYRRVLSPLSVTVAGFRTVANGDFSRRVPVNRADEIGSLAESFNHLSNRLDALLRLLTGLEQGADLEGTLHALSKTLPALIPLDWIGVLVVGHDGRIHLEMAFGDGQRDNIASCGFEPEHTLLQECIQSGEPLHIPDVQAMGKQSDAYVFLRRLSKLGRRDAIFLPISNGANTQGVAVFASRFPNNFRAEHLALVGNLGGLIGVSLGRTIQFLENSRLASIGQFASGIAHEIRNPLATIALALDHLNSLQDLPEGAQKRIRLGTAEVARLERLLADILLYAKPLRLQREPADLAALVEETLAAEDIDLASMQFESVPCPLVLIDRDRLRQVLLNLIHNARQASTGNTPISIRCQSRGSDWVEVEIKNGGDPIPDEILDRIFEPFVTSKSRGTGLGLPIVQRIVQAHGGTIEIRSNGDEGTRARLLVPTSASTAINTDQIEERAG